jgi:membrane protease YdiL (CAAX protease family)
MKREVWLALVVYLVELVIVAGHVLGWVPVHPIVLMLPLVGLVNFRLEGRGRRGLGLVVRRPARSLLLVVVFAALSFAEHAIRLRLGGISVGPVSFSREAWWALVRDLAVDLFIIAMWEEVVSRGYIQTRLQAAWGGWGVVVATLLFATLHLPSALTGDIPTQAALRFLQTGLSGFLLGILYWRTGSILPTILVHGLRNFAGSLAAHRSGLSFAQVSVLQTPFQLLWLAGEVGLMILVSRFLLPGDQSWEAQR